MPAADTVLTGARVRTLDPERPEARAVAVRDGEITAVGDEPDVRDWRGPATEVIDLHGATLTPGLTDAHSHPVWGIEMATGTDLSAVRDPDQLRAALRAADRGPGGWIQGYGLDHNAFAGRPVDRCLVEDALGGAPAFLRLYDGHSALASGAALAAAGITGPRAFDQRSEIVCDADGRPTGHLVEHAAMDLVGALVPKPSSAERRARLLELLGAMAATGLTGAHVMDLGDGDVPALLAAVEYGGDLPLRLNLAPWCMPGTGDEELAELIALQRTGGRHWRIGGVKFFMDGTVEGGTAWLEHADCHGQGTDAFWPDPQAYARAVRVLDAAGVRTATHAIGDAAVRHVLDTVAALGPGARMRHRIEHIETVPDDQLGRFAELGVIASMQPPHTAYTRADHTDEWSRRLGEERAAHAWRCRDLRDAGAVLALGSDWPIAHYDARRILTTARSPLGAASAGPALTGLMALEGLTSHAALAAGEERVGGTIAPGHRADLTAFTVDPVTAGVDELAGAPIRLTLSGGRITHREETV
ncbi:amidohydrolase [Streptomyces subrutilus]|uniref:Amidohydrolase n=1 Tax=Streptomyces subrutilus TaxID=36818 RepID=A0A5P2UPP8_9ACTN|nr:amidohydrolase [Streptomyces subrutilus]QEU80860.1 amidohydrolase [Streptomyces subrutilus]WSJ34112.1 amidohydrolase [Streptomyces subrutilus]GGZ97637.1 amidohydrolase [Streptomyces subrutilus]